MLVWRAMSAFDNEKGPSDVRHGLFGGRGAVRVSSLLNRAADPFTAVLACELEPGGSVGAHVQDAFPELVIGLSGQGQASVDGGVQALEAGDSVFVPLGAVLTIENLSRDESLQYLIIKARG
jgi:quercetin dioxygenase-like cupin family protein